MATDGWQNWLLGTPGFADLDPGDAEKLLAFLLADDILWQDGGLIWLGSESERRYRRRNFMEPPNEVPLIS